MPTKHTPDTGVEYEVSGKTFTWHPLDEDGKRDTEHGITLPLRLKLKVIRTLAGNDLDVAAMFTILEALAPGQADAVDEMDLNDFQAMFTAWQAEYMELSGASLGE